MKAEYLEKLAFFCLLLGMLAVLLFMPGSLIIAYFDSDRSHANSIMNFLFCCFLLGIVLIFLAIKIADRADLEKQKERDKLFKNFQELLNQGQGLISLTIFKIVTQTSQKKAKAYLDEKAKALDGDFYVNEKGNIYYRFNLRS